MTESMTMTLTARAPFAELPLAAAATHGVWVTERDGLGIANILLRSGRRVALAQRWRELTGTELPDGPRRVQARHVSIAGTGPDSWLCVTETGGCIGADSLRLALAGTASVVDQSDGYAVLRLSGPQVRPTLAKLVPIDVHSRVFPVGGVAITVAAHIGAILWRLSDGGEGHPVFEIAVSRSMAGSFWHALDSNAGEFGTLRVLLGAS